MANIEMITNTARNVLGKIGWQILMPSDTFLNWDIVTGVAWDFAHASDALFVDAGEENRRELVEIYGTIINRISPLISDYLETEWPGKRDRIFVFDRAEWIVVNVENLRSLLSTISQDYWEALGSYLSLSYPIGQSIAQKISEVSLTSELGFLFGYLSKKVLAQYDFGLPKADGVVPGEFFYFVEPNILNLEQKFNLDPVQLRLWIALHEATHSFQFKAFPWLKDYINSLINEYLKMVDEVLRDFKHRTDDGEMVFSWGAGWWKNPLSSENRKLINKVQALMCLIEGYSEHVMMHVGQQFPGHDQMIGLFKERRRKKPLAEQILEKLIGFDLKIKQYALGERFASYVAEKEGIRFLNKAWECQENLPAWDEIQNPQSWINRIRS